MANDLEGEVTRVLHEIANGNVRARDELVALIYDDLKKSAAQLMRGERVNHTLQPTALVHEAIIRLSGSKVFSEGGNRAMLFHTTSRAMRQVLVDHARGRNSAKREGSWKRTLWDDAIDAIEKENMDIEHLDAALAKLEKLSQRQYQVIDLRFFGGLSVDEIAELHAVSKSTVEKELQRARAFLHSELAAG